MDVLVIVDMQNDFIDGTLRNPHAKDLVPKIAKLCKNFNGLKVFTQDTHDIRYKLTIEGKNIPKHCYHSSQGWEIPSLLMKTTDEDTIFIRKSTFGSLKLVKELQKYKNIESITLVGVCTDICVLNNAIILRNAFPYIPIKVKANLCAGSTKDNHNLALSLMKNSLIEII